MKKMMDTKATEEECRKAGRPRRKTYTLAEKLCVVEETMQPGASISRIARDRDLNANLVFTWRRQHARGELVAADRVATTLLPVRIEASGAPSIQDTRSSATRRPRRPGSLRSICPAPASASTAASMASRLPKC